MKYSKQFQSEETPLEGKLSLEYPGNRLNDSQYIQGEFEFSINNISTDYSIRLGCNGNASISPSLFRPNQDDFSEDLEVYIPEEVNELKFTINVENIGENFTESIEVVFHDLELLIIGDELFREENFSSETFRNRVKNYIQDDGNIWPLINFASDLAEYTEYNQFITIINKYFQFYDNMKHDSNSILDTILKRALLGKIGNGRHHTHSLSQFESTVNDLSNISKHADVNPANSIQYAMKELDKNEELGGIIQLSRELQIIDLYPDAIYDKVFYILLSEEIIRQSEEGARNLINEYFEENKKEFDEDLYEKRLNKVMNLDNDPKAQKEWYDLVSYAQTSIDSESFKHLISSLLYWTARKYADTEEYYHVTPKLFRGAALWFEELENETFSQVSYYEIHQRKGLYYYHKDEYEEASDHFQSAISISANESGEYSQPLPGSLEYPVIYKSLADAKSLVADNKKEKAADLLAKRRESLENLKTLNDSSHQRILSSIGGERFRILAEIYLEKGDYQRAKELLEKAIGLFDQANHETSFEVTLSLKLEVEAVIKEVNGQFKQAARLHDDISEDERYNQSQQYIHSIRSDICRVKSRTKNKDFEGALKNLKNINRKTNELKYESRQLGILLRLLSDYESGKISDVSKAIEKLSKDPDDIKSNHPLDVEYDYTEPLIVVLALERLSQTDLPKDLLDCILELSVQRALTPKRNSGIVEDSYISDISIERLWRERLPSIILNRIERVQIDSVSIPGDYKSVTLLLAELVEFSMALLIEYHSKRYWGRSWRSELTEDDQDTDDLSIGTLSQIFYSEAAEDIENCDELEKIYFSERAGFDNLTEMRNKYDHAYKGSVSESEFEDLKGWVFDFLRECVHDSPVIVSVEGKNDFGICQVRVHWWRGQRKMLLETDANLDIRSFYYISAEELLDSNAHISHQIDANEIIEIDDDRVIEQIKELPKYSNDGQD